MRKPSWNSKRRYWHYLSRFLFNRPLSHYLVHRNPTCHFILSNTRDSPRTILQISSIVTSPYSTRSTIRERVCGGSHDRSYLHIRCIVGIVIRCWRYFLHPTTEASRTYLWGWTTHWILIDAPRTELWFNSTSTVAYRTSDFHGTTTILTSLKLHIGHVTVSLPYSPPVSLQYRQKCSGLQKVVVIIVDNLLGISFEST